MSTSKWLTTLIWAALWSVLLSGYALASSTWTLSWDWRPSPGPWRGKASVTLPEGDGPVTGVGTWDNHTYTSSGEAFQHGRLLIRGRVENDVLTFTPQFIVQEFRVRGQKVFIPNPDPGLYNPGDTESIRVADGAETRSMSHGVPWVWRLTGGEKEQRWQVSVRGWELVRKQPPTKFNDIHGRTRKLSKAVKIHFDYTGKFVLKKGKKGWYYKNGTVTSARSNATLAFDPLGIYNCSLGKCPNSPTISRMVGKPLTGSLHGSQINLYWPPQHPRVCVKCWALNPSLPKTPYEAQFIAYEIQPQISMEDHPLKNGYSKTFKKKDWFFYTITLTRLK